MAQYMSTESNPDVIPIDGTYQKIPSSYSLTSNISELFNLNGEKLEPTNETQHVAQLSLLFIILTWSGLCCLFNFATDWLLGATWLAIISVSIFDGLKYTTKLTPWMSYMCHKKMIFSGLFCQIPDIATKTYQRNALF